MANPSLLKLTFPSIVYASNSIPIDLRVLLYKGGARESSRTVLKKIAIGDLGDLLQERVKLVGLIHSEMNAALVSGKSQNTAKSVFYGFKTFFIWVDNQDIKLSIETAESVFRQWSDHLLNRVLKSEITMRSAYSIAGTVGKILTVILERPKPVIATTRLQLDRRQNSIAIDDQNLSDIFKFGHLLIDIVNNLNIKAIYGTLPVKMELRNGVTWNEWSGISDVENIKTFLPSNRRFCDKRKLTALRSAWENEHSVRTRSSLINLRLQAELLIFLAQTGMNLTQARKLKMDQANYTSSLEGYQVRSYKNRKGGEVSFEIFSQYREHFEKYLTWRKQIFKDSTEVLFPFCYKDGSFTLPETYILFLRIKKICQLVNTKYCGPRELRKTRINWLLRQSRNPDLTAEQAQHTKQVLYRIYEKPSLQVAKIEFIQFWKKNDPTLKQVGSAPAPGVCNGTPMPIAKIPSEAPKPDCIHPSGCLFCEHHRDIDSHDYVWSLASMKQFNAILITKYRPIEKNKPDIGAHVEMALEMLVKKLKWFESSNEKRKKWVNESLARCNEEDYHPHWGYLIECMKI